MSKYRVSERMYIEVIKAAVDFTVHAHDHSGKCWNDTRQMLPDIIDELLAKAPKTHRIDDRSEGIE